MINLKCPNCGADISTDDAQTSGKCPYCNSRFAAEKKPEPKTNTTNENYASIYNAVRPKKPRPRIKFGILFLLFFIIWNCTSSSFNFRKRNNKEKDNQFIGTSWFHNIVWNVYFNQMSAVSKSISCNCYNTVWNSVRST